MNIPASQMLDSVEELASIGHWTFDLRSGEVYWSAGIYRIHGYAPFSVQPTYELAASIYGPADRPRFEAIVQTAITEGVPYDFTMPMTRHDGVGRMVRAMGRPWHGPGGDIVGLFGVLADITEEHRLQEHNRRLGSVLQSMPEGVVITDLDGFITWVNPGFEALSGYTLEESLGRKPGELLQGPGTDPDTVQRIRDAMKAREPVTVELLNYNRLGDPYWLKLCISPRFDDNDEPIEFMALEIDISEQRQAQLSLEQQRAELEITTFKLGRQRRELRALSEQRQAALQRLQQEIAQRAALEEELRRLASTDEHTGLANRRAFFKRAEDEVRRATRYARPMSVMMLDIDHFKRVNDTWGHAGGDAVLVAVARILGDTLRRDIDLPGRVGGEEFAVLLPETDLDAAVIAAEHTRARIADAVIQLEEAEVRITCSIGVASLREGGEGVQDLIRRADAALYRAKNGGRNQVQRAEGRLRAAS